LFLALCFFADEGTTIMAERNRTVGQLADLEKDAASCNEKIVENIGKC